MATIGGILRRLVYARYLVSPRALRWIVDAIDYAVEDHLEPARRVHRGARSMVHPSVTFRSPDNITLGNHTRIQDGCVLWASPGSEIRIGDYTGLGPGTMVFSSNHKVERGTPYVRQEWIERDVSIGKNVWVGARCVILPGVTIGDDSVVAAGAVVTRNVSEGSVVAGIPAKSMRAGS